MKALKTILVSITLSLILLILTSTNINASEGYFELKNQVGQRARCEAYSVLMQDLDYEILLTCRDIIYPGGTDIFSYVVWANPLESGNPFKLGEVGLGKAQFRSKTPFSSLFITKEQSSNIRVFAGPVVMQGGWQQYNLDKNQPQPTPLPATQLDNPNSTPAPDGSVAPAPQASRILRIGGTFAIILLIGIIIAVFLITRPR